jgi:hypothetical protein
MTQTIQALNEALRSPDMGVRLVVDLAVTEIIRLRSFSSRLSSAGSCSVEAIDDLIFSISQNSLECTVACSPPHDPQPAAYCNCHLVTVRPLVVRWRMESRIVVL